MIYTWADASLRELTTLVQEVQPAARRPSARIEFAFVYPDRKGRNVMRQVYRGWLDHNLSSVSCTVANLQPEQDHLACSRPTFALYKLV